MEASESARLSFEIEAAKSKCIFSSTNNFDKFLIIYLAKIVFLIFFHAMIVYSPTGVRIVLAKPDADFT